MENQPQETIRKRLVGRYIDSIGRCVFTVDGLTNLIIFETDITGVLVEADPDIDLLNQYAGDPVTEYTDDIKDQTLEEYDEVNRNTWFTPKKYQEMDIESFLLNKCKTEPETMRVQEELNIYSERNLYPVLKHLVFLIDHFRKNSIVWGVGRGSSVSSYVLFLIGVHKVDSIRYNLSISDFLK
jgi:DNA polymerase III alpha subunit